MIPVTDDHRAETIYAAFFETDFPSDLTLGLAWLGIAILVIFVPFLDQSPIRVALALPVLLFLPGYSLVSALFPKEGEMDLLERLALSVGLSIAIVPLVGLGLNYTPFGIRLVPLLICISVFIFVMFLITHYRRARCLPEERFRPHFRRMIAMVRKEFPLKTGTRTDRILNAVLLLSIIIAVVTTVFVIAVPKQGEHYTEFYLLGKNRMAADYPDQITAGEIYPLYIGVGNHEYRTVAYTIETYGTIVETDNSTNTSRIVTMDLLWQHPLTLAHNETVVVPYDLSVQPNGYNRIDFLLFNETMPGYDVTGSDRIAAANRDLHLWVTVRDQG